MVGWQQREIQRGTTVLPWRAPVLLLNAEEEIGVIYMKYCPHPAKLHAFGTTLQMSIHYFFNPFTTVLGAGGGEDGAKVRSWDMF